jgi:PIF1 helicase.
MEQARLFVMDEMSMVGRQMLGKIEFKVRDTLRGAAQSLGEDACLAGRDTVLAGDPKQANPIGDDPMYREGDYAGKGQNKPRGSDRTPSDAWSTHKLVRMGMLLRNSFEDVALLRQVHRFSDESTDLPPEKREEYRAAAVKFLEVTRGMADCTWEQQEHAWLSRRNRSVLQQTQEGRQELRKFDNAPLLMDGRQDRVTGEVGANRINQLRLERLSAESQKPIAVMRAYYDRPDTEEGKRINPEKMDADDFRGMEHELLLCEGARILLTQNLGGGR